MQKRGRKSGRSSHHELDTLADGLFHYYSSMRNTWTPRNQQRSTLRIPGNPLGARMHTPVRLCLHYLESLAIPCICTSARVSEMRNYGRFGFELRGLEINMDGYIKASGFVLYPYVFVAGPNTHDCSHRTKLRGSF